MNTTVQLKDSTIERLKFFKTYSKESYDELINKLLTTIEEGELTEDAIKDIQTAMREMKAGKGQPIEDVAKEFGVKL